VQLSVKKYRKISLRERENKTWRPTLYSDTLHALCHHLFVNLIATFLFLSLRFNLLSHPSVNFCRFFILLTLLYFFYSPILLRWNFPSPLAHTYFSRVSLFYMIRILQIISAPYFVFIKIPNIYIICKLYAVKLCMCQNTAAAAFLVCISVENKTNLVLHTKCLCFKTLSCSLHHTAIFILFMTTSQLIFLIFCLFLESYYLF